MTPADLATLSLLDPDQGVCPNGHSCRLDEREIGRRICAGSEYRGMALICWDITVQAIDSVEACGGDVATVMWARSFIGDQFGSVDDL